MSDARSGPPFIDEDELLRRLPMADAIDALERAFAAGLPALPDRQHHHPPGGDLLVMPAWSALGSGVKLVNVNPGNTALGLPTVHGVYALFEALTGRPTAIIDGGALTALRTAAVSGLATRHLARSDARRVVIHGTGRQAWWHAIAMTAVRDIADIVVVGRTPASSEAFAARLRAAGLPGSAASTGPQVGDIVCTCTTSAVPIVRRAGVAAGSHVNAIGAYRPEAREIDGDLVVEARVFVESVTAALAEAGDLLIPMAAGTWSATDLAGTLHDVVTGRAGRATDAEVTLYKGVGVAFEDLVVAAAAMAAEG